MTLKLRFFVHVLCVGIILTSVNSIHALSSNARNDPYPVFTTLDPHTFLQTQEKLELKGWERDKKKNERLGFSISPFGQTASDARDVCKNIVNIGDLDGKWAMIGLLYGALPDNQTWGPQLLAARQALFPTVPTNTPITDTFAIDQNQQFGFYTIPINYRKLGVRFELSGQLSNDIGLKFQTGVADICQTTCSITDLTGTATSEIQSNGSFDPINANITKQNIQQYLMDNLNPIADEIGLDVQDFHDASMEDVRGGIYWRHAYLMNEGRDTWDKFILTPFIFVEGSVAVGKEHHPSKAFGLPFGDNGHNSIGLNAGLNLDFVETIEIGVDGGFTHFFSRNFCNYRVPTSEFQSGIYPFFTDVCISPGDNWQLGAKLSAFRFLERLSGYFQYVMVTHKGDCIHLKQPDEAFMPGLLEKKSCWRVHLANIGFNYDISPYISLGFLWQAPLMQLNAYRETTLMFSFNVAF